MKRQLRERLAGLHVEISDSTAERQQAAVFAELKSPSQPARSPRRRRVRTVALAAATVLLALPAAAVAADGAVPGDLLYPIKRATEQVLLIVDPNIATEHRIEELEIAVDRGAPLEEVTDRLVDAERSAQDQDVPEELQARFDVARDRVAADYDVGDRHRQSNDSGTNQSRTERPRDDVPSSSTTSTSAPSQETDEPPRDSRQSTTSTPETDRPPSDQTPTTSRDGNVDRDDRGRDG